MTRTSRVFPLAVALGAALAVVPASAPGASNGGAVPVVAELSSGGASAAQSGGAAAGQAPKAKAKPKPSRRAAKPAPAPAPAPRQPVKPTVPVVPDAGAVETVEGIFPVQGFYTFGGRDSRFGAGRPGHIHQGQDVSAASGTPIVAPVAGTVTWKANQPGGAGIYLVIRGSADGRDYVFMHIKRGTVLVSAGTVVSAGQPIAQVGATGVASGPHLHFEIWVGGWQERGGAPVDPLPQLQRWAPASA